MIQVSKTKFFMTEVSQYSIDLLLTIWYRRTVQKNFHNPDNHDDVITHLEPDILKCGVGLRKQHYEQS